MAAVPLYAVQTPSKVLLPGFVRKAAPIFFVVMHGFLAHSGAMNSFVVMLRNAIDAHNRAVLESNDQTSAALPFHITALDARNHGLSPHTSTHSIENLVEDLSYYLAHDFPRTVSRVSEAWMSDGSNNHCGGGARPCVVAIGHSMGSITWTQYLMDRYFPSPARNENVQGSESPPTAAASPSNNVSCAPQSSLDVKGLVSLDLPPIVRSNRTAKLTNELIDIMEHMKAVNLSAISDLRSGQEEFYRCGMHDIRVRGLCTTNLALQPDPNDPTRRVARWKCNVPVLEASIRSGQIFLPDSYYKPAAEGKGSGGAHASEEHKQNPHQLALEYPSVGMIPVLSVLGAASPVGGDPQYQQLWERYAIDLRQHSIPHATHTVYFDKPHETIELVTNFLKEIHVDQPL
ncbi:hypothetical protein, conserved [Leishmania tarentolae]|uniref:Uncharacterized protein n=1 Tax=Leishmania tarentolae TaxID=5689 RepID=A0A640KKD8_LEITA|nr:hypothetical protein, conserved [Leishmania tarentolae]